MKACCDSKSSELEAIREKQGTVLKIVLLINLIMFFVEAISGFMARSTSLLADSLDMLGDAFVYGFSLYAIGKTPRWGASTSLLKGSIMLLFGIGVLFEATRRFLSPETPVAATMGLVGGLAFAANVTCAILLMRHRNDDLNMRSTWLCTRNDVVANIGVMIAAAAVGFTQSRWPDLVVGVAISTLVLKSAYSVLKESISTLRQSPSNV